MDKILITGASGYIGTHLAHHLCTGYLHLLDKRPWPLPSLPAGATFELRDLAEGSKISSIAALLAIIRPKAIVHLAALANIPDCESDPERAFLENVEVAIRLAAAAHACQSVKRFIFLSTAAVYCPDSSPPPWKTGAPCDPQSVYADTKFRAERSIAALLPLFRNASATILRVFNVAGQAYGLSQDRGERETHLVPLLHRVVSGRLDRIALHTLPSHSAHNPATPIRDYIHILDLCDIIARILDPRCNPINATLNAGSGGSYSAHRIVELMRRMTGHPIPVEFAPPRIGDVSRSVADISKTTRILGWTPRRDILATIAPPPDLPFDLPPLSRS